MPTVYIMVGLPGTGKSTYRKTYLNTFLLVSSDEYIEGVARSKGLTYNDVFSDTITSAQTFVWKDIKSFTRRGFSFVVDQTNMTRQKRMQILSKIPADWHRVAVVFEQPPEDIHNTRLASRPGKVIPEHVMTYMIKNYDRPEFDEGFNEIRFVRSW